MKIIQQFLKRFSDTRGTGAMRIDTRGKAADRKVTPAPLLMALEPRVVYDASVAVVAPHPHGADPDTHAGANASTNATAHAAPKAIAEHDVQAAKPAADTAAPNAKPSANANPANTANTADSQKAAQADTATATTVQKSAQTDATVVATDTATAAAEHAVVFIDPSVADYQSLIAGLPAGTRYVVLNATTDGFAQIAQYLQTHQGIESVHLISHGTDGEIQAGSTWLNAGDLSAYSGELAQIGASMKAGGDFLIYGCDVAENADGKSLVQQVAALTHLNVAASTDATGASALGGNWTLEYQVGTVHTAVIESAAAQQQFDSLLGVTVETYDQYATSGYQNTSASFTLDGVTYITDASGPIENDIYTRANDVNGGTPNLSSSATDATLMLNFNSDPMSQLTIQMSDGSHFALSSFDLDAVTDGKIYLVPNGDTSKEVLIYTGPNNGFGGTFTDTVNVAGNANFQNLTSVTIVDVGDDPGASFVPSLDNLTYSTVAGPSLTASSGSAAFTAGDNVGSTPVPVDANMTLSDSNAATAQSATVTIGNFKTGDELLFTPNPGTMGNISAVYSNGVLTLTSSGGNATIAQWQTALDSITFTNTQVTPDATTRTINFSITDSAGATATATRNLTVTDTDQTPVIHTSGGSTSYVAGGASTTIDSGLSITDSDSTHQASATVTIGNAGTGDILNFTANATLYGNISGTYVGSTHTLTLTGSATDAQWQSALDSIGFSSGASTSGGARIINFSISDGTKTSAVATKTVNVSPVPIVTTDSGSAAFVSADNATSTPVTVDSGITVAENGGTGALASATVAITGNFQQGEDNLLYVNNPATMGDISGAYNAATGVLTLTSSGHASLAQWQAALRSITYTDSAASPATPTRTISFTANDGTNSGPIATRTVTVTATDNTPIVTLSGSNTTYTAGTAATVIDGGVSVTDRDPNAVVASATVSITGGFQAGDTLFFINSGLATGSFNSSTGVLTLTANGSVSDAQWATVLDNVKFSSGTNAPAGVRTVSFTVNDGTKNSAAVTRTVTVGTTPIVTIDSGSAAFVAGDNTASTPVAVDSGITVADGGSTALVSATVQITGNFHAGEDLLLYTPSGATGDITGTYNGSTGLLTLTSASHATLAQWQAALRAIAFDDTAVTPNSATRTISFTVNDGSNSSPVVTRTVTVQDTDQTPIVTLSGSNTAYTAGHASTVIDSGIDISDLDNTTLTSATVSIGSGFQAGDILSLAPDGIVTSSYNTSTGVLTLTAIGNVSIAQWASELDNVRFSSTSNAPAGARTVSYTVNDGTKSSDPVTRTVTVTAIPVVTTDSGSAAFVAGDNTGSTPVAIDSGITVADGSSTLVSATVSISGNFHSSEDILLFTNDGATMGDISGSYDATTGVLTLSSASHATLAQWQSALRSVAFFDSALTPNSATRTVAFSINDGANSSPVATRTVTVTDTDQSPILTTSGCTTAFVEADNATSTPVAIDSGVTVSDLDNGTFASAHVSISGGFAAGQDVLAFSNTDAALYGDITATYDSSTGVLTLASGGASTVAQWQAALRAVTYTDTAITPSTTQRTISFTVNDGAKDSNTGTHTVSVAGTDQSPVLSASSGNFDYLPGDAAHTIDSGITLTDTDNPTMASLTVRLGSGFQSGDQLSLNFNAATMSSNFNVTFDGAAGTLTITRTGTMTLANWQAIVDNVQFSSAPGVALGTRTLSLVTSDGTKDSNTLTYDVDVISSAPQLSTTSIGSASFIAGDNAPGTPVVVDGGLSVLDPLGNPIQTASISITANLHSGEDILLFTNDGLTMGDISGSYNALTGTLTLFSASGTATDGQWNAALHAVMYTDTAVTPIQATRSISFSISDGTQDSTGLTRNVTVTAVDQTPVVTTSGGDTVYVEGDNVVTTVAVDSGITVTDSDNTTLASATVAITGGFHAGEDQLSFDSHGDTATFGNIVGSYDATTGQMTLNSAAGTATLAQWQAALRAVTYSDTAATPDTTARIISFNVSDGTQTSGIASKQIDLTAIDQSPVVTSSSGHASFTSADNAPSTPIVIDSGLSVTDSDSTTLLSGTVSISGGFHAGQDVLGFTADPVAFGNITGSYDASTGVLTLSSAGHTASVAQWQAALDSVTYVDTAVAPAGATRTISFSVNDGTKDSVAATRVIDLTATTQTPGLSGGAGGTPTFTASGADATPVTIDSGISIADRDPNAHLDSAQVSISGNFQPGQDVLAFHGSAATGNISASFDPNTGVLTLSSAGSSATLAQWQAALAAVTYADTAAQTSGSTRTVDFAVTIDGKSSGTLTRTVNVAAGPVVTPPPVQPPPDQPPPDQTGAGPQPNPPTLITLPPHSPFIGGATASSTPTTPPTMPAPDTLPTFPLDLGGSISNPLIVLDAFADAPEIGAIPTLHTATFSTGDFGETGASNGSGVGGGTHWHGSLSETSVQSPESLSVPDAAQPSLDLPSETLDVHAAPNQPFTVSLPVIVGAEGLPAGADTHVELRLADGRPLPAWLHYDPVRGTLSGKVPANQRDVQIAIIARDAAGHQTRREISLGFGGRQGHAERAPAHGAVHAPVPAARAPHAAAPLAKPSLAEQFARAHATLHVARPVDADGNANAHAAATPVATLAVGTAVTPGAQGSHA